VTLNPKSLIAREIFSLTVNLPAQKLIGLDAVISDVDGFG